MNFPPTFAKRVLPGRAIFLLALIAGVFGSGLLLKAQSKDSASVHGTVRDSGGGVLSSARVTLLSLEGKAVRSCETDARGAYSFSGVGEGSYRIESQSNDSGRAASSAFALKSGETATIDLRLLPAPASARQPAPGANLPEFYDEPTFTVSGVTDTTNLGGHGSDAVVRTKESLAKEAVSLANSPVAETVDSHVSEAELRQHLRQSPNDAETNLRLGRLLVADNHPAEALPFLRHALELGQSSEQSVQREAELRRLLGDAEEKSGNALAAVRDYQRAAELEPTEENLFSWGAELLLHHAYEPASQVFENAKRRFPTSQRVLVGLGVGWYGSGSYDQANRQLCAASDLNPGEPGPYLFLGKLLESETASTAEVVARMKRFAELQPGNAWANYYFALALWKQHARTSNQTKEQSTVQVTALLQRAIQIDPKLAAAHLQLGIVASEQGDVNSAIASYQASAQADPQLPAAHYRLSQVYRRMGDTAKAQEELEIYNRLTQDAAARLAAEHHEIQQFVYTLRNQPHAPR